MEAIQCNQPATKQLAVSWGNGAMLGIHWGSLLLADFAHGIGLNPVGIGECKFIWLSSHITTLPATMATWFMSPLSNCRGGWERGWLISKQWIILPDWLVWPSYLIIKILLCWGHPFMCSHMEHKYLHVFLHREIYPHTPHWSCFFQVPDHPPNHGSQPVNRYISTHLAILPSKQSEEPGALLNVLPTRKTSLHCCPSGIATKWAWMLQVSHLGGGCMSCRAIYQPSPSLPFLCQLIIGNFPRGQRCRWG